MKDRPFPDDIVDTAILGHELKIRLASRTPRFVERVGRNGQVYITQEWPSGRRDVPIYDIDDQADCTLSCHVRVEAQCSSRESRANYGRAD
jgi:hypothetical protein